MASHLLNRIAKSNYTHCVNTIESIIGNGRTYAELTPESLNFFSRPGYLHTGFRAFYAGLAPAIYQHKKMLLVRDPRDILVSRYYSIGYSHPLPPTPQRSTAYKSMREKTIQTSIDNFVIEHAPNILDCFNSYIPLVKMSEVRIYRYEDIVYSKHMFIHDMCQWGGIPCTAEHAHSIAATQDVFPVQEDIHSHVRQVAPGNHRAKLKPDTIAQLNSIFKLHLELYGYRIWPAFR